VTHMPAGVLITGGSRGIGRACCELLANHAIPVASISRTAPAELCNTETHYPADLTDLNTTVAVVRHILSSHPVDAIVCNAGRGDIGSLENFSARQIHESLLFNLINPITIIRECLPHLRKQARSNVVMIGSTSALHGGRYGSLYSAAKFGLRGAAQSLAFEVSGANCHVGIVHPGSVRTGFFDTLSFEPGPAPAHAIDAEDVAAAVSHMLFSPDHAVLSELLVQPRQHVVRKKR